MTMRAKQPTAGERGASERGTPPLRDGGVRVRFAPSPTGHLHIGSVRTALFNWLLARHEKGVFILRVEDTDRERSKEEYLRTILSDLKWLGLDWDEGPFLQSERLAIYREHADKLLSEGKAYPCYCSQEELAKKREIAQAQKRSPGYDGTCRGLTPGERGAKEASGRKPVLRFLCPLNEAVVVDDAVRGRVEFSTRDLEDFVIMKSDGFPMYNFACVVDDALMEVSHVLRGEEHLSNTPRQVLLYKAFGWDPPVFGHLSIILDERKKKLSKREGATYLGEFREAGFLPEALLNFLSLLGWAPGSDREILPIDEIIRLFGLGGIVKSPAVFDSKKLLWMNGEYIRQLSRDELVNRLLPFAESGGISAGREELAGPAGLFQERMKTLKEFAEESVYLFTEDFPVDGEAEKQILTQEARARMEELLPGLESSPFNHEALESVVRGYAEEKGLKLGEVVQPIRFLLTGRKNSPGIFEIMSLLGRENTFRRLAKISGGMRLKNPI